MRVLLDTNAYTALFRGHEGVVARVRRATDVLLSTVVAGEGEEDAASSAPAGPRVVCWTCHRGKTEPEMPPPPEARPGS